MKNCTGILCGMEAIDPETCPHVSYCPDATPPTNGDVIRAMSDDELASFIIAAIQRGGYTPSKEPMRWIDWLQHEAG